MDVIDPLNTIDSIAPHSTSFSSNIYLLKHEEKSFKKGDLLSITPEILPTESEILYFTVGFDINPENFVYPFKSSSLCRLYGYKITSLNNKIVLTESESSVALGRVYLLEKTTETTGSKIGTYKDSEIWGNVHPEGIKSEGEGNLWEIMKENFGNTIELAYYWFLETGVFYGQVELTSASEEEVKILENLDILSLVREKIS